MSVYVKAKERGPKVFVSQNAFLDKLHLLDFPNKPDIMKVCDELIRLIENTPTVETGMQEDMIITKDMIDAFDNLFYLIRLEAADQGIRDWNF